MEILRALEDQARKNGTPFLLIGGHAVNTYGIARQTVDIDLLVPRDDCEKWHDLMVRAKYAPIQQGDTFVRYKPLDLNDWPIDFMFVDEATFNGLYNAGVEATIGTATTRVASANHLVALKLHAMKVRLPHRFPKDFSDVVDLLRTGASTLTDEDLSELCERYADADLYDKIKGSMGTP